MGGSASKCAHSIGMLGGDCEWRGLRGVRSWMPPAANPARNCGPRRRRIASIFVLAVDWGAGLSAESSAVANSGRVETENEALGLFVK